MMDETDSVAYSAAARLCYFLLFAAQGAATQFFSLYLKYLGLSAGDAGVVRGLQTWSGVAAALASGVLSRALSGSARGRKAVAALLLLSSLAGYVSLVFVPPFATPRDVTHCSRTAIPAANWGLLVPHDRNVTRKLQTDESFHRVVQDVKDKTFNTSPTEVKSVADPKHLQSETTAPTPDTNESSTDDYNWHKFDNPTGRDMEAYGSPEHKSDDINGRQPFNDKSLGKKTSPVSWDNEGTNGILNSYHKMENTPFIFNYELPFTENSQKNSLPHITDGENDSNMLAASEDSDHRYQSHHLKPDPPVDQHNYHNYQWSDQSKIDELQRAGVPGAQLEGDSKTLTNPELKTFQKIFFPNQPNNVNSMLTGRKPYQYKQPLHTYKHRQLQFNEADNDPYYSDTDYKVHNTQQEDEQEEDDFDLSKQYGRVKSSHHDHLRPQHVYQNGVARRSARRVHTRISNSDVVKTVDAADLFHLELVTSDRIVVSEITTRKLASENTTDSSQLLRKNGVLNNNLNNTSEILNSSHSVVDSMYADSIAYFSTLRGFGASKYGSWSTVFYTVFIISVFLETSCQSALVWILRVCGVMTRNTCEVLWELATSNQVLVGWALIVCPLVGVAAALSPCPYQITAHMAVAAALTFCALLLLPLVSPVSKSRKRKPSKPSYRKTYEDLHATLIERFSFSLRMGITGFITACNLEFMMWYMEAQETFPQNYEYLYCGYAATASVTQCLLNRLLRKRSEAAEESESESEDETGGGRWQLRRTEVTGHERRWWLWEVGTLLLGFEQVAAQLRPVWVLPPLLGTLQGAGTVLSSRGTARSASASYGIGYGCGCLAAGLFVEWWGAAAMFQVLSLGTAMSAAAAAIVRGVTRCAASQKQQARAHSFSIASAESDASSDGEENEIAETDDWLVQALQRDEYRQAN